MDGWTDTVSPHKLIDQQGEAYYHKNMDLKTTNGMYCLCPKEEKMCFLLIIKLLQFEKPVSHSVKYKTMNIFLAWWMCCEQKGGVELCEIINEAMKNIMREQEEFSAY